MNNISSEPDRNLVRAITVGIARILSEFSECPDERLVYCNVGDRRNIERAAKILIRMGAARICTDLTETENGITVYELSSMSDLKETLLPWMPLPDDAPVFDELLATYVGIACNARNRRLCKSQIPFHVSPEYENEITALHDAGYIVFEGPDVRWTKKIGPIMEELGEKDWIEQHVESREAEIEVRGLLAEVNEFTRFRLHKMAMENDVMTDFMGSLISQFDCLFFAKKPDGSIWEPTITHMMALKYQLKSAT